MSQLLSPEHDRHQKVKSNHYVAQHSNGWVSQPFHEYGKDAAKAATINHFQGMNTNQPQTYKVYQIGLNAKGEEVIREEKFSVTHE